ncbi:MAG: hypothetical protein GC160_16470 [Acidobacteria bacterium]|nr:hypothetical protein [Acidobacteriota bacterium]
MNVLGSLAALAQQNQQRSSAAARPVQERQPPAGRLTGELEPSSLEAKASGELAQAEAETLRMMEEAAREMARDVAADAARHTVRSELKPWEQRLSATEAKVIDTDAAVLGRLSKMEEALEAIDLKALEAERFELKLNVLIGLVAAVFAAVLFLALR